MAKRKNKPKKAPVAEKKFMDDPMKMIIAGFFIGMVVAMFAVQVSILVIFGIGIGCGLGISYVIYVTKEGKKQK